MLSRLKGVLPSRWFGENTPVLDTLLGAMARSWAWAYGNLMYIQVQTRISTATGSWLDLIAGDFFGGRIGRKPSQSDNKFRQSIQSEVFRERGTRKALYSALVELTGQPPIIFEPANCGDTGAYGAAPPSDFPGAGGAGYGCAGGWGSLVLPFQTFVTAFRPRNAGIAAISGWNNGGGGYGVGAVAYCDPASIQDLVTDADISSTIASVAPISTTIWVRIQSS